MPITAPRLPHPAILQSAVLPAIPGTGPGPFPNKQVLAANFDASVSADGMGYPPNIVQSSQGAAQTDHLEHG